MVFDRMMREGDGTGGGTPSWYDGGWAQELKARNKSLVGSWEWSQGQGAEAASESTDLADVGPQNGQGDGKVTKNYVVLKEQLRELQRTVGGKKSSVSVKRTTT